MTTTTASEIVHARVALNKRQVSYQDVNLSLLFYYIFSHKGHCLSVFLETSGRQQSNPCDTGNGVKEFLKCRLNLSACPARFSTSQSLDSYMDIGIAESTQVC